MACTSRLCQTPAVLTAAAIAIVSFVSFADKASFFTPYVELARTKLIAANNHIGLRASWLAKSMDACRPEPFSVVDAAPVPLSLCTIIHDEASLIGEWVTFHRAQGVGRIWIWDDGSTDIESVRQQLASLLPQDTDDDDGRLEAPVHLMSIKDIQQHVQGLIHSINRAKARAANSNQRWCGPDEADLAHLVAVADQCVNDRHKPTETHVVCQFAAMRVCGGWAKSVGDRYMGVWDVDEFLYAVPKGSPQDSPPVRPAPWATGRWHGAQDVAGLTKAHPDDISKAGPQPGCYWGGCGVQVDVSASGPAHVVGAPVQTGYTLPATVERYLGGLDNVAYSSVTVRGMVYGTAGHENLTSWHGVDGRGLLVPTHLYSLPYQDDGSVGFPAAGCEGSYEFEVCYAATSQHKSIARIDSAAPLEGINIHAHFLAGNIPGSYRSVPSAAGEGLRYNHYSYPSRQETYDKKVVRNRNAPHTAAAQIASSEAVRSYFSAMANPGAVDFEPLVRYCMNASHVQEEVCGPWPGRD